MTKSHKIQKLSSIIPFVSTVVIAFLTMVVLKKRKASAKIWLHFLFIFFLSGSLIWLLNEVVMSGQHLGLNMLASWLLLVATNILFVDIQIKCEQTTVSNGKPIDKKLLVICLIATAAVVTSIVVLLVMLIFPSVDIKDSNGINNTNLAVINLEEVFSQEDTYTALGIAQFEKGASTSVDPHLKKYDSDEIVFRCKKISGVKTLQATKTTHDQLTLKINPQVESGNMEVVILVDGTYYAHVPINEVSTILLTDIAEKIVVVKMAAESAKTNISIQRSCG